MKKDTKTGKFESTHGMSRTIEYKTWQHMKQRCYDKNYTHYRNWGGRGITVCDRWLRSFENFYADMGKKPSGLTLDRIDNDGNYEPTNCRWATKSEQLLNQRLHHKNKSGYAGVFWDKSSDRWRAVITFNKKTTWLGSYIDKRDAIKARKMAKEELMASKQKMIDNAAERLMKGKPAAVKNRKKRILKRGHKLGGE